MEPWQSWAIVIGASSLAYLYYTQQNKLKPVKARASSVSESAEPQPKGTKRREETKQKKKVESTATSEPSSSDATSKQVEKATNEASASKKRKTGKKAVAAPQAAPVVAVSKEEQEAPEDDNKAWAEQLASLKKGTSLAPPARNDSGSRTVKQRNVSASPAVSSASSTGGIDADDDLSPAMSPSMRGGDVSDMLEARSPGPSVLRLTEPSRPQQTRKAQPQKEFEAAETKKQRQNRRKIEEKRLEREAEEKQRQALLERQRKTAREARGEPARNGVPVPKPPAVNAWTAPVGTTTALPNMSTDSSNVPLLDTFDQDAESTSSSTGALNNSTAATSTTTNGETELPSEEDQMRMAIEDDAGWNTVPKGKKQKKQANGTETDGSDYAPTLPASKPAIPATKTSQPMAPQPKASQPKANGFAYLDKLAELDAGSHPDDSEWAA